MMLLVFEHVKYEGGEKGYLKKYNFQYLIGGEIQWVWKDKGLWSVWWRMREYILLQMGSMRLQRSILNLKNQLIVLIV